MYGPTQNTCPRVARFDKYINENNPNGYTFDTSYNYAPIQGAKALLGLRWTIQ